MKAALMSIVTTLILLHLSGLELLEESEHRIGVLALAAPDNAFDAVVNDDGHVLRGATITAADRHRALALVFSSACPAGSVTIGHHRTRASSMRIRAP